MKKIIRSNAVEKLSQQSNLGIQISDLRFRRAWAESSVESAVLSPRVNLSVLPPSRDVKIKNKSNRLTSFELQIFADTFSPLVCNFSEEKVRFFADSDVLGVYRKDCMKDRSSQSHLNKANHNFCTELSERLRSYSISGCACWKIDLKKWSIFSTSSLIHYQYIPVINSTTVCKLAINQITIF